jgi:hypothetical protein
MTETENYVNQISEAVKVNVKENYSIMPSLNGLPHMEPHLLALYRETHLVTLLSLHNVSIIMQGVLLEALVKEIIFEKEKIDFEQPFGPAIERCEKREYLDSDELKFLTAFKNTYRNSYQHVNIKKITQGKRVDSWAIKVDRNYVLGSLLRGIQSVKQNKAGEPKPMGYDDLRPVGYVIKQASDKEQSLPLFIEVDKFFREMLGKYLPPSGK